VREAGTPSRPGKIHKTYSYNLTSLIEAMDDARLRSFAGSAQVVVRVNGPERIVFRRYEHGKEVAVPPHPDSEPGEPPGHIGGT
jgi:hypothetical protein